MLLYIPCCCFFFSFFFCKEFVWYHVVPSFLYGEFFLHNPSWVLFMRGVSVTHSELYFYFYVGTLSYTCGAGLLWCEELLFSAVWSEDNPLRKELGGSWSKRKLWKSHTQAREGSPRTTWTEQNKTKTIWVISGHRNERGRKEMDLSSKQDLAEKDKKWMDPSSANYPKDKHTKNKGAEW